MGIMELEAWKIIVLYSFLMLRMRIIWNAIIELEVGPAPQGKLMLIVSECVF